MNGNQYLRKLKLMEINSKIAKKDANRNNNNNNNQICGFNERISNENYC